MPAAARTRSSSPSTPSKAFLCSPSFLRRPRQDQREREEAFLFLYFLAHFLTDGRFEGPSVMTRDPIMPSLFYVIVPIPYSIYFRSSYLSCVISGAFLPLGFYRDWKALGSRILRSSPIFMGFCLRSRSRGGTKWSRFSFVVPSCTCILPQIEFATAAP